MSEKRFTYKNNKVYDNLTGEFHSSNMVSVNVLNEQQDTITELESDKAIAEDYANLFEKENVKLRKQIDEQQITIENLRKWLIAEQKQVEKRDAFIEQKGLMSEFVKELEDE